MTHGIPTRWRRHVFVEVVDYETPHWRAGRKLREQAITRTKNEAYFGLALWGDQTYIEHFDKRSSEDRFTEKSVREEARRRLSLLRAVNA